MEQYIDAVAAYIFTAIMIVSFVPMVIRGKQVLLYALNLICQLATIVIASSLLKILIILWRH